MSDRISNWTEWLPAAMLCSKNTSDQTDRKTIEKRLKNKKQNLYEINWPKKKNEEKNNRKLFFYSVIVFDYFRNKKKDSFSSIEYNNKSI